jgi:hypothetical protein
MRGFAVLCWALVAAPAWAQEAEPPPTELRIDVGQLYTVDDLTDRHVSFTEARGTFDVVRTPGDARLELRFDGRSRLGWSAITDHRVELNRLSVAYGHRDKKWLITVGRQVVDAVSAARVDGGQAELRLGEGGRLLAFGGLMPHPLSGAFDQRFVTAGAGYEYRDAALNHSGGAVASIYRGEPDRIYLTERLYWRIGPQWLVYGHLVLDLISARGFLGDLLSRETGDQSALERIDLTSANASVRWRPGNLVDFTLSAHHNHTLLPRTWWADYLEEQRAERGFVLDGVDPVGTRRSSARLVTNLHLSALVTPYLALREDLRHEDSALAHEIVVGVKLDDLDLGYLDLSATGRDVFGTGALLGRLAAGTSFDRGFGLDAGAAILRAELPGLGPELLIDLDAALWLDLKTLAEPLGDLRILAVYQAFIDPEVVLQAFFLRLGYRWRDG